MKAITYSPGSTANATTTATTITVSIGSGTATSTSLPITSLSAYSYSQQIFTQAQVNAAGTISKLRFYYSSGGTTNSSTWDIYLARTSKTTFSSTTDWISTTIMTRVFSGIVTFPAAGNWMEITLTTQFHYNNTNNLVIAVDENTTGNASSAANWGSFTSGTNTGIQFSGTVNYYPEAPPAATSRTSSLNRIQLVFTPYTVAPAAISRLLATNTAETQDLTITNTGVSTLIISNVTDTAAWLTYSAPTPITILPGNSYTLTLTMNATGLPAGTNTTNMTVTTGIGTIIVPVSMKVITTAVPTNPRHVAHQFEPSAGALIRYPLGLPYTMIRDMADNDQIYCVVSSGNQAAAISAFTSNGVNMANMHWIVAPSDSYWSRDWGPFTIFEDGPTGRVLKLIDFHYNRNSRTNDDALAVAIANYFGYGYYSMPTSGTGGNSMPDGLGKQYSDWYAYQQNDGNAATGTESGFTEIYSYTQTEFEDIYRIFLGMSNGGFNYFTDPTGTYIHHIDTWAKMLEADKVVIARVPSTHAQYAAIEAAAARWSIMTSSYGTPFAIYRIDCPNNEPYINSFHFNSELYLPFMGTAANDNAALAVYQSALPNHLVRGYTAGSEPWVSTDAIHCRINTMFAVVEDPPSPVELSAFTAMISATNFVMLNWITQSETNVAGYRIYRGLSDDMSEADMLNVFIPATNTSQMQSYIYHDTELYEEGTYYYWLENQDFDGANGVYGPISIQVQINSDPGIQPIPVEKGLNNIYPNPFNPSTSIQFGLESSSEVEINIYNLRGQIIRNLLRETRDTGYSEVTWDGKDNTGKVCATGVYYITMRNGTEYYSRKAMLVK